MAHTVNGLFDKITSADNIETAIVRASKGKKRKRTVRYALSNLDKTVDRIQGLLKSESYNPGAFRMSHEINDGFRLKKRIIVHPSFDELIISHAILQILKPIFMRKFFRWSCGSIPGRGQESMIAHIKRKMDRHPEKCKYYVKLDVAKCFDSINTDKLIADVEKYIRDSSVLNLIKKIIGTNTLILSDGTTKKVGVPIGLYTSPWFANITLNPIDHIAKDSHGIYIFVRYIDDMLLIHGNKRELQKAIDDMSHYMESIGLKWKTTPIIRKWSNGNIGKFRFCGVHLMRDRIQLHDAVYIRARRTANRIKKKIRNHKRVSWYDAAKVISYSARFKSFFSYSAFVRDVLMRAGIKLSSMRQKMSYHGRITKKKGV